MSAGGLAFLLLIFSPFQGIAICIDRPLLKRWRKKLGIRFIAPQVFYDSAAESILLV